MFTDQFVPLHIAKIALRTEERRKDERFPVFAVGLVLEPLTYSLVRQLGADIASHCFTDKKSVREEMTEVTVALDEPEQCLIARMAQDVDEHDRLRQVRIRRIKITKRDASTDGAGARKSKKIGPQQPTLRATLECLIDPAEKAHRDFLCAFFAKTMYFTFEPEQENLFTGVYTDDDDEEDKDLPLDGRAPAPDPDAGDVLDDTKKGRGRRPRTKGNGSGARAGA